MDANETVDTNDSPRQGYDIASSTDKLNTADESHKEMLEQHNFSEKPSTSSSTVKTPSFREELTSLAKELLVDSDVPQNKVLRLMRVIGRYSQMLLRTTLEKVSNNFFEIDPNNYSFIKPIIWHLKVILHNYGLNDSVIKKMLTNESRRVKTFISPETYIISERKDAKSMEIISVSAEFIPLRHVFKKFFELSSVFDETMEYINALKQRDRLVTNFVQGVLWKILSKNDENKNVLPLFLYFDKYKDNDSLGGSHQDASKCRAVYVSIPCLPAMYQSKLKNVFLFVLFNTLDRENIKNPTIFYKIQEELKFLETTGIVIDLPDRQETLYFRLSLVLGDNLGSNYILGFSESSTSKFCRFCTLNRSEIDRIYDEKDCELRTVASYETDLMENNPQETGIVERCIFTSIGDFHPVINIAADLVLDVLEGICRHDLSLIFHYFIEKKYFNLCALNIFINACKYSSGEPKPAEITEDHIRNRQIIMSASEIVVLIRYLPVMIGHLIPIDDEVWRLALNMRTFINIISGATIHYSPFDIHMTDYLLALPELFPNSMLPQHHFLIHYPKILYLCGPLWKISAMQLAVESKEKRVGSNADAVSVDVCKSIAMRYQLCQNYRFVMEIVPKELHYDADEVKKISLNHFKDQPKAHELLAPFATKPNNEITVLKKVEFRDYVIELGSVFEFIKEYEDVPLAEEDNPIFFLVQKIILDNKTDVHVLTKKLYDVGYCEHYDCWKLLSDSYEWDILSLKEINYFNITHLVDGINDAVWIFGS